MKTFFEADEERAAIRFCMHIARPSRYPGYFQYDMQPQWVYLIHDRAGHVVYVGRTNNPQARAREHRKDRSIKSIRFWQVPADTCVVAVEAFLIAELSPKLNRLRRGAPRLKSAMVPSEVRLFDRFCAAQKGLRYAEPRLAA